MIDSQEMFFIYEGEVQIYIQNTTGFREDTELKKLNVIFLLYIDKKFF